MNKSDLIPVVTQEECAEVIQAISKVFRFGLNQLHPTTGVSNKEQLEEEIGQLVYMLGQLTALWRLDGLNVYEAYEEKGNKLTKYEAYFPDENAS